MGDRVEERGVGTTQGDDLMARNRGQQTERDILKKIGAKRQLGSGSLPGFPNDGVIGKYLLEVKSTQRRSLGIKRKWLEDLEENAITRGKIPAMIMIFNSTQSIVAHGLPWVRVCENEWVTIPRRDFELLTKGWKK